MTPSCPALLRLVEGLRQRPPRRAQILTLCGPGVPRGQREGPLAAGVNRVREKGASKAGSQQEASRKPSAGSDRPLLPHCGNTSERSCREDGKHSRDRQQGPGTSWISCTPSPTPPSLPHVCLRTLSALSFLWGPARRMGAALGLTWLCPAFSLLKFHPFTEHVAGARTRARRGPCQLSRSSWSVGSWVSGKGEQSAVHPTPGQQKAVSTGEPGI